MRTWIACIGLAAVLLNSCSSEEGQQKPDDLIDRSTMVEILVNTQLIESIKQRGVIRLDDTSIPADRKVDQLYAAVYDHYGVTPEAFRTSYAYYQQDPEELSAIYDDVLAILLERQAQVSREANEKRDTKKEQESSP